MKRIQRNTLALPPVIALAILLAGCNEVSVPEPVGEEAVVIDATDWQGTWLSGEVVLMTTVLDATAGRVQAAWMERYDEGAQLETSEGVVRRTGDSVFLSMPRPNNAEPEADAAPRPEAPARYLWARVVNDGRTALLWWPDAEAFRAAVREGRHDGWGPGHALAAGQSSACKRIGFDQDRKREEQDGRRVRRVLV